MTKDECIQKITDIINSINDTSKLEYYLKILITIESN